MPIIKKYEELTMSKKRLFCAISVALLTANIGLADGKLNNHNSPTRTGFFLAPAAGIMLNNGTGYKNSPELTLSFGYSFTPYISIKAGTIMFAARSEDSTQSTKFSTYTRADVAFSLPTRTSFTPYLLAGIGKLNIVDNEFASNIGLGIAYTVSQHFALTANYRTIIPAKTLGTMNLFDVGFVHYF